MLDNREQENDLAKGHLISGRYRIERCLGAGGMGAVYLATDLMLEERKVAVKVLHKEFSRDKSIEKRFVREVQLMHAVNHQNVVRTFDIGREGDLVYFTMEYMQGEPLDYIEDQGEVSFDRIASFAVQICAGLEAIHNSEVVHRDLKPGNIMILPNDVVKITDFGVARPKSSDLTQHNEIVGSVHYMAPEVWLGKPLTPAIDFYSLGIILYELVTGTVPFESEETARMMWLHVKRPPNPPKSIRADTPQWLNQLILKLLAKTPEDRLTNAREIIAYIQAHAKVSDKAQEVTGTGKFALGGSGRSPAIAMVPNHESRPVTKRHRRRTTSRRFYKHGSFAAASVLGICAVAFFLYRYYSFFKSLLLLG